MTTSGPSLEHSSTFLSASIDTVSGIASMIPASCDVATMSYGLRSHQAHTAPSGSRWAKAVGPYRSRAEKLGERRSIVLDRIQPARRNRKARSRRAAAGDKSKKKAEETEQERKRNRSPARLPRNTAQNTRSSCIVYNCKYIAYLSPARARRGLCLRIRCARAKNWEASCSWRRSSPALTVNIKRETKYIAIGKRKNKRH